ncbi:hypothetical protein GM3708_1245 [Geminocystis sp. NIES-3708]|uniref:hypothetical protein n=1 Tax=Geminocystis sp. NIES-3708 TaxID=1615909 RepID=UPI0005FCC0FB|nr:hypothetical protein [Geminocystis sp. NIES-3708]BAQ60839.1 hypothetical protein GM3708_1245 [Geminocystis sp. NIES-3708]
MLLRIIGIGLKSANILINSVLELEIVNQATVLISDNHDLKSFSNHFAIQIGINNLEKILNNIKKYQKIGENILILAAENLLFFDNWRNMIN